MSDFRSLTRILILILPALLFQQCTYEPSPEPEVPSETFRLVEEVRIGDPEGEEEYFFGDVGYVEVGKEGRFLVADTQVPIIRMYDAMGRFVRNVGRQGRGPGEFNRILGMQAFPDGGFAVSDPQNRRVNLYSPEGEPLRSHIVQNGLHSSRVFQVDHSGNFYIRSAYRYSLQGGDWEYFWQQFSPEGDSLGSLDVPPFDGPDAFVIINPPGYAYPFLEQPSYALSPLGYLVKGDNTEYRLEWNPPGDDPITVEREYDPVTVKPEEQDEWEARRDRFDLDLPIPDTKPAFKDLWVDMEGRIWVSRYVEAELTDAYSSGSEEQWWERPTYDVFLPDGSFYGRVVMPWRSRLEEARGDNIWAVLEGDQGEPYVIRYRMEEFSARE